MPGYESPSLVGFQITNIVPEYTGVCAVVSLQSADVHEEEEAVKCTWIRNRVPDVTASYDFTQGRMYILGTSGLWTCGLLFWGVTGCHTNGLWFQLDICQTVWGFWNNGPLE